MTQQNLIVSAHEVKGRFLRELRAELGDERWRGLNADQVALVEDAAEVAAEIALMGLTGTPAGIGKTKLLEAIVGNATYAIPETPQGKSFGDVFWPIAAKIGGGALLAFEGLATVAVKAAAQGIADGAARRGW